MKKIFCCFIVMASMLTFAACNVQGKKSFDPSIGEDVFVRPTVEDVFTRRRKASFASLSLSQVLDGDYIYQYKNTKLILELTVEEDYYDVLEAGTKVYYTITLSSTKLEGEKQTTTDFYERQDVIDWLEEKDGFLVYFRAQEETFRLSGDESQESYMFDRVCIPYMPSLGGLIPIKDGRVYLSQAVESEPGIGYKYIGGIDDLLQDGISLEEAEKNIRALAIDPKD